MSSVLETQSALYDALVSIDIPNQKAQAVVDALEQDMTTTLTTKADLEALRAATKSDMEALGAATKSDLETLRAATKADFELLGREIRQDMRQESALLRKDMEIRLRDVTIHNGYMLVLGLGLLFAALQLS